MQIVARDAKLPSTFRDLILEAWEAGARHWATLTRGRGMRPYSANGVLLLRQYQVFFDGGLVVKAMFRVNRSKWIGLDAYRRQGDTWNSELYVGRTEVSVHARVNWIEEH